MKFRTLILASLAGLATIPAAALAQTTPEIAVGALVYGPQGNEVGKVAQVAGGNVMVDTGKYSAALPASAFVTREKGLTIGMTKDQLESAIAAAQQAAQAQMAAALVPGAQVFTSDGMVIGTVKNAGADGNVTIDRGENGVVAFQKNAFALGAKGLTVGITSQALADQAAARAEARAKVDAALVADAQIFSSDGVEIGKVADVTEAGNVNIARAAGNVLIPKDAFSLGAGGLQLAVTAQAFEASVAKVAQ